MCKCGLKCKFFIVNMRVSSKFICPVICKAMQNMGMWFINDRTCNVCPSSAHFVPSGSQQQTASMQPKATAQRIFGDISPDQVTGLGGAVGGLGFSGPSASMDSQASGSTTSSSSSGSSSSGQSRTFGSQSTIGSKPSFHSLDRLKNVSFDVLVIVSRSFCNLP